MFYDEIKNLKSLSCYSNEGNKWRKSDIKFQNENTLLININEKFIGEDAIAFECAAKHTDLLRTNHIQTFCPQLHSEESTYRMSHYLRFELGIRDAWGYPWP